MILTFLALGASSGPALAQILNGPAKRSIESYLGASAVQNLLPSPVFYGDFDGDGRDDAVAFVYAEDGDGDSVRLDILMFTGTERDFRFLRKAADVGGENPRNVRIRPGSISFVLTTPDPDQPDATRSKTYAIRTTRVRPQEVVRPSEQARQQEQPPQGERPQERRPQAARPRDVTIDVQETGSLAGGRPGGMLGRRLCSATGKIQFNQGQLVIEYLTEPYILTDVAFGGCQGETCTYRQPQHGRVWVTTRQGAAIIVRGPVQIASANGRMRLVDDVAIFGPCQ
ncbi:hypothetical protein [Bosea sp. PAMC 26642]|uniref:hypothetical protein n=1 Tax=Bosea sp. (strain PAMC 26642) TaxID=1792307 RepID=UPI0012E7E524|nr:hypothetical protein [Bosea sp. PAMC 26642]